jgi:glycosyltransferase involved in cell wall biosynthesis
VSSPLPIYVASHNTLAYTELCIRSLHRHADQPFDLIVGDSASTDGSRELLGQLARAGWLQLEAISAPRRHAEWLDRWLASATSEYVVWCDSDIEFLRAGILADMRHAARRNDAVIVSPGLLPAGHYEDERLFTHLMPRPTPWLMLVHVASLRALETSYEEVTEPTEAYSEGSRTFDVGALLYHRAVEAGMRHAHLGWRSRRKFRHFGGASWRAVGPVGRTRRRPAGAVLQTSLEAARRAQPSPSGLAQIGGSTAATTDSTDRVGS